MLPFAKVGQYNIIFTKCVVVDIVGKIVHFDVCKHGTSSMV